MATFFHISKRLCGRGSVLALLGVLHAGVIYALSMAHGARALDIVSTPIEVTFVEDEVAPPPPPPPPRVVQMPAVDIITPLVDITYLPLPPAAAITLPRVTEPSAPTATGPAAIEVADVEYMRPPAPRYPPMARRARAQGTVFLRVLIDAGGRASDVKVYRSSGSQALDDAACEAVRGALFKPHRENGVARVAMVTIPIEFSLTIRNASRVGERERHRAGGHDGHGREDEHHGKRQARLDGADDDDEDDIANP